VFKVVKHRAEALQKTGTLRYKGLHQALKCEVLDRSSELRLPHLTLALSFVYNLILFMTLECALGHRSCIEALVA
jgi:hypothetical protein